MSEYQYCEFAAIDRRLTRAGMAAVLKEHAEREADLRRRYDANLRLLITEVDNHWAAVDAVVQRGSGSGYDEAVRALVALARGYTITSSREAFDHALRQVLVPHTKRGALMCRLSKSGLASA